MAIVHAVIALALLEFFVFGAFVGRARVKYGISAPDVSGHPVFERYYRVHYNTLEQLIVLIPSMLLFAHYISETWAAILGMLFVVARILYLQGYVADPKKRSAGFGLGMLPMAILLLGGLGGAIWESIR
jgi:uncharacterized membrane protein YecN with MAPEG domain